MFSSTKPDINSPPATKTINKFDIGMGLKSSKKSSKKGSRKGSTSSEQTKKPSGFKKLINMCTGMLKILNACEIF